MTGALETVVRSIETDGIVDLARELVQIPSVNPPGDYAPIAALMYRRMHAIGLETVALEGEPGKTNIFGLLRGRGGAMRTILLSGHMDVVGPGEISSWRFDPFAGTIADGALWGRGSVDMKGALAAQLFAVKAVKDTVGSLPVNVMLGATVDDEIAGDMGQKFVLEKGLAEVQWPRPALHILGEASDLNIIGEFKGRVWIRVTLGGRSAHGGAPEEGVNAIDKMFEFIRRLREAPRNAHPLVGPDTLNVGTIRGGTRVNAVADECEATLDVRFSGRPAEEQRQRMFAVLEQFQRTDGTFCLKEFSPFEKRDPVHIQADCPEVVLLRRAISRALGRAPKFLGTLSAGDAYHSLKSGIPAVWVGPGDTSQLHAPNEHIRLEDLYDAARVYASILLAFAGIE